MHCQQQNVRANDRKELSCLSASGFRMSSCAPSSYPPKNEKSDFVCAHHHPRPNVLPISRGNKEGGVFWKVWVFFGVGSLLFPVTM